MKELIKNILKKMGIYEKIIQKRLERKKLTKKYKFENRMKNKEKVCFILTGYKEFSYEIIFKRIKHTKNKD